MFLNLVEFSKYLIRICMKILIYVMYINIMAIIIILCNLCVKYSFNILFKDLSNICLE